MGYFLKMKTACFSGRAKVSLVTAGLLLFFVPLAGCAGAVAAEEQADAYFELSDGPGFSDTVSEEEYIPGSGEIFLEDFAEGEIIYDDGIIEEAAADSAASDEEDASGEAASGDAAASGPAEEETEEKGPSARERLAAIEKEEAEKRTHKESILLGRLRIQLLSDGTELGDDASVYYICDNGADYVVADDGGTVYIYEPCITRSGEYFLTEDTLNDAIREHVAALVSESYLSSTEEFWNHIQLRDAPQHSDDNSQSRPTDANGVMIVPYYNQGRGYLVNGTWLYTDWPSATFNVNGHTMSQAGCGFFSTAMALSYVSQRIIAPVDFKENGQYIADNGSAVTVGVMSASLYNIPAYITSDINEVLTALRNGQPVMEHVGSQPFTNAGHYILLVGVLPDGTIAVNDPAHVENTYWYCGVSFPLETIVGCMKDPSTAFTVFG